MPVLTLDDETVHEMRRKAGLEKQTGKSPCIATRAPNPAPASPQRSGEAVLAAHEQLMQEFLASQQRSIEALLDKVSPRQ